MACGKFGVDHDDHWCTECANGESSEQFGACKVTCADGDQCNWKPKEEDTMPQEDRYTKKITSLKELQVGDKVKLTENSPGPFSCGLVGDIIIFERNIGMLYTFLMADGKITQDISTAGSQESTFCSALLAYEPVQSTVPIGQVILDKINLVSLNINIWQGKKAMTAADLAANGIDINKLPPTTLANLGSKRIVAPEMVAPFNVLKRTAAKECAKYGVRFGSCGYAVPEERMDSLCIKLKHLQVEFREIARDFVGTYDQAVSDWIGQNPPEWAPIIAASVDSAEHVAASLSFRFSAMKVVSPGDGIENGLDEEVNSLYGQLCHEVRAMAKIAYETSYKGKDEVSQRAIRPIVAIREKLAGMAFLDPSITDTITIINDALCINTKGPITGRELNTLSGLVGNKLMHMGLKKEMIVAEEEPVVETEEPVVKESDPTANAISILWDF